MASSVFYKFKSRKDESRVNFDGTGISVFDLKKEIILANNLGKANDFDLCVYDSSSNEGTSTRKLSLLQRLTAIAELKDDSHIIPRSSAVVVKRVFAKPGRGKAAMYIAGTSAGSSTATPEPGRQASGANGSHSWRRGNMTKRFDGKEESPSATKSTSSASVSIPTHLAVYGSTSRDRRRLLLSRAQSPRTMKPQQWPPCSKPKRRIGRKRKKRCLSWCRAQRFLFHVVHHGLMNILYSSVFLHCYHRATRIYSNPRGGGPGGGRGGKPFQHHHIDRPLPPSYVCYRCGQKGLPTSN